MSRVHCRVRRVSAAMAAVLLCAAHAATLGTGVELLSRAVNPPSTGGGTSTLSTVDSAGSGRRAVSANGRYVVFVSDAANLVPGQVDTNDAPDVFVRDRATGGTVLVSHSSLWPVRAGNAASARPAISADGRFIAFWSGASDLVAGVQGADASGDVFLFDRETGANLFVSRSALDPRLAAASSSGQPVISGDGRFVAYLSSAPDLVPGQVDAADTTDVFLFDRVSGLNILVSHAAGLDFAAANAPSSAALISEDGNVVAYSSGATDLLAGQAGPPDGVFLYDRATNSNLLVTHRVGSPNVNEALASGSPDTLSGTGR